MRVGCKQPAVNSIASPVHMVRYTYLKYLLYKLAKPIFSVSVAGDADGMWCKGHNRRCTDHTGIAGMMVVRGTHESVNTNSCLSVLPENLGISVLCKKIMIFGRCVFPFSARVQTKKTKNTNGEKFSSLCDISHPFPKKIMKKNNK